MKQLQRLSTAAVLTIMLAISVFAGDIPIDKPAPPPAPPSSFSTTTSGDLNVPDVTQGVEVASDSFAGIALSLLQSMLSVF